MERGPMALFGAIVAVGLGPALWLGAQFGTVAVSPDKAPTVIVEQKQDAGGKAGSAPEDPAVEIRPTPRSQFKRLSATPSAEPSTGATSESPAPDDEDATTEPSTSTASTPSDKPSTPPTEDTSEPTVPSTGDDGDEDTEEPPAPPQTSEDEPAARA